MPLFFRVFLLVLLLWLMPTGMSQAEPIAPLLSPTALAQLRAQLNQKLPDTSRVRLLLTLSTDLLARYDELLTPLDSTEAYGRKAYSLSIRQGFIAGQIESLYVLGQLKSLRELDTLGKVPIRRGIALSQQQHNRRLEALGWYYLARTYPRTAESMPLAIGCYQRAGELFRQAGAQLEYIYLLKTLADMHVLQGHSEQATRELLIVLKLYKAAGHRELHYTYDLLRATTRQAGNYKEALRYGLAAIESAHATHDTIVVSGFYSRVASIYNELKQNTLALAYYRRALRHAQQTHFSIEVLHVASYIAHILISEHQPQQALDFFVRTAKGTATSDPILYAQQMAECYMALKRYAVAERYLTQMLALTQKSIDNDMQKMYAYQATGTLYLLTKRYDKSRWYLQQALQRYQRSGFLLGVANLHLLLFKVDSAQARFPAAIAHYQRYKQLNDSVFNATKNKQLASLEIQYDTRKKEQNIALLTKQTQAQQARLRQREFQRNALVIGALLLVGLLGLSYNRYRLKQRATQQLEAKQAEINQQNLSLQHLLTEKDWMLKEIHHRVKNNLEIISSLLETQADYLRDPAALAVLRESQNRVHAMALIHQKLYQSGNVPVVDMAAYIREITEHLMESFDCQATVQMRLAVAPIKLEVTLATPLGLLINEALTNAFKYAFPYRQPGIVAVELAATGLQQFHLTIADNGVGFPPQFDVDNSTTMGLTIMRGLSGQLDGHLRITQDAGVQISLDFEAVPAPTATL